MTGTEPTATDAFARALAFRRRMHEAAAGRAEPLARGVAFLCERLPLVPARNLCWIEAADGATVDELAADAERVFAPTGVVHRRVAVVEDPAWKPLQQGFRAGGWDAEAELTLVHPGPENGGRESSPRAGGAPHAHRRAGGAPRAERVREASLDELLGAADRLLASEPETADPDARAQALEAHRSFAAGAEQRCFVADADGEVGAFAKLWHRDGVVQVADVAVLADHRGRGLGRAVVGAALAAAREHGPELTFMVAGDRDRPTGLHVDLGFVPAGRTGVFTRRAGAQDGSRRPPAKSRAPRT